MFSLTGQLLKEDKQRSVKREQSDALQHAAPRQLIPPNVKVTLLLSKFAASLQY